MQGGTSRRLDHVRTDVTTAIVAVELAGPEPGSLTARWGAILDRVPEAQGGDTWEIGLDQGVVRFVTAATARTAGITGLDVAVVARPPVLAAARARGCHIAGDTIEIGGIQVRLV